MVHSQTTLAAMTFMFKEAAEASKAVATMLSANAGTIRSLAHRLKTVPPAAVITCARGSSDNAATYGRYLIETGVGIATGSMGLSVASVYRTKLKLQGGLCLAMSQSGASPDLLAAVEAAKAGGALTVALVNAPSSPLADIADEVIQLSAGTESSVAATKSFITTLAALAWLLAEWRDDSELFSAVRALPHLLARAWSLDWTTALPLLQNQRNMFTLGRGPGLSVAQEAALKLKETSGLHAEALSAAEVLHGPIALAQRGFASFVFAQRDASHVGTCEMAKGLVARHGTVIMAGATVEGACVLPTLEAHPIIQPILLAQSFYRLAAELSIARGLNPDRPPHLSKVTRTV